MRLKLNREEINLLKEIIEEAIYKERWEQQAIIYTNEKGKYIIETKNKKITKLDRLRIIKEKLYGIPIYEEKNNN